MRDAQVVRLRRVLRQAAELRCEVLSVKCQGERYSAGNRRALNWLQEEKKTRIIFGIMDKERRGFLAGKSASTKQPIAMANINKQHFLLAGSCAVVRSVFSRSSLGGRRQGIREVNEKENLKKSAFLRKYT